MVTLKIYLLFLKKLLLCLFLAVLGLRRRTWAFSSCGKQGLFSSF